MKKICIALLGVILLHACKREKSIDTSTTNPGQPPVFIGNNCQISQILTVDSSTSIGFEAHNLFYTSGGLLSRVQLIDSLNNTSFIDENISYKNDTIFIQGTGFMVRNSAGRVRFFRGLEDPSDPASDTIDLNFTYSTGGNLTRVDYSYTGIPVTILRSTYSYSGNNLTKVKTETLFPAPETVFESDLTYSSQTVRNFIYTFTDAYYTFPYLPALDFGNKPTNALQRVKTVFYDMGVASDSLITNYKNYKLSNDGYVLEFFAEGDYQDGMGIYDGRTKLRYVCR